ncbi:MAG: bacillithiol system redox-active protein YtxJ, partial [Bacteroidota bacterium]
DQLTSLIADNQQSGSPIAIFKHSTRCSISATVKSRLERKWPFSDEFPIYLLDLLEHRDISDRIAGELSIQHESPQLIVLNQGKVMYHASHLDISAEDAQSAV